MSTPHPYPCHSKAKDCLEQCQDRSRELLLATAKVAAEPVLVQEAVLLESRIVLAKHIGNQAHHPMPHSRDDGYARSPQLEPLLRCYSVASSAQSDTTPTAQVLCEEPRL
jgi:hypothetical protein